MTAPRNILFITIDQWRAEALGCAGNPVLRTPHLDDLARDGIRFSQHFASASPCAPSRASLLTGMYQHNHGVVRNGSPLDYRFTNVALESRKAGYDPALLGYTDTAADPRAHDRNDPALHTYESVMRGFTPELHLPEMPYRWLAWLRQRGYDFGTDIEAVYRPDPQANGEAPTRAPARFKAEHTITAYLTGELLDFIAVRRDQSWFAHAAHIRPHPPFIAPEPYNTRYSPADMPLPHRAAKSADEARQHPLIRYYLESQPQSRYFRTGQGLVTEMSDADLAQLRATYYGMVSEVDDQMGRLIAQLKAWDLYDSTLIIVTSDHGEMLGDHWMLSKEGYFAEAYHVPLIIRDPRAVADEARGRSCGGFTEAVDIMPTILDWIGVPRPRQCDGRSLLALCAGTTPEDWRREVHFEFDFRDTWSPGAESSLGVPMDACGLAVLRDEKYQYVHCAALPPLFFDLAADPYCLDNRANDPALAATMLHYAQRMLSWRMESNAREQTGTIVGPTGLIERESA